MQKNTTTCKRIIYGIALKSACMATFNPSTCYIRRNARNGRRILATLSTLMNDTSLSIIDILISEIITIEKSKMFQLSRK